MERGVPRSDRSRAVRGGGVETAAARLLCQEALDEVEALRLAQPRERCSVLALELGAASEVVVRLVDKQIRSVVAGAVDVGRRRSGHEARREGRVQRGGKPQREAQQAPKARAESRWPGHQSACYNIRNVLLRFLRTHRLK
tara:strand:+ start:1384 stop:1806 length:423 start_codon:yes stop_codon:yes gene_type:complete